MCVCVQLVIITWPSAHKGFKRRLLPCLSTRGECSIILLSALQAAHCFYQDKLYDVMTAMSVVISYTFYMLLQLTH